MKLDVGLGDCKKRSWGDKLRADYTKVTKKDIDNIIDEYERVRLRLFTKPFL